MSRLSRENAGGDQVRTVGSFCRLFSQTIFRTSKRPPKNSKKNARANSYVYNSFIEETVPSTDIRGSI